jgi:predicted Zn finger-like uncharacterized protein
MNVSCPECRSIFRVDPTKVPAGGIRARCSVCGGIMSVGISTDGRITPRQGPRFHLLSVRRAPPVVGRAPQLPSARQVRPRSRALHLRRRLCTPHLAGRRSRVPWPPSPRRPVHLLRRHRGPRTPHGPQPRRRLRAQRRRQVRLGPLRARVGWRRWLLPAPRPLRPRPLIRRRRRSASRWRRGRRSRRGYRECREGRLRRGRRRRSVARLCPARTDPARDAR